MAIKKDTLHPEGEPDVDIYPKTSIDQVENLQANLDALNGDIANANGEIANISTDVNQNIIDISDIKDDITVLNTAYGSYTDYTEVTNGFLLTYLSGKQIELPIKAGTNVTFSKYPGSNQIIINSTGGSVPDNIALLDTANTFTAENTFNETTYYNSKVFVENAPIVFRNSTKKLLLSFTYYGFVKSNIDTGIDYSYTFPNKTGTIALTTDIPTLANYPTTIFFNNYTAGIGYKDISTGTIKTVVSTDNNGAQIVLGDSNTGLTLATNARPKVLEDSTVKEVAYVSDIPTVLITKSQLLATTIDFPFDISKNYFFTITMSNNGDSKSFIYASGTSTTYTIDVNGITFEVKIDAVSTPRLIFTNKTNTDPFVVRAEISN